MSDIDRSEQVGRPRNTGTQLSVDAAEAAGLCATCVHVRIVTGARSTFVRCDLSDRDPRFPRYPTLPVRACDGYEQLEPALNDVRSTSAQFSPATPVPTGTTSAAASVDPCTDIGGSGDTTCVAFQQSG